MNMRIVVMGVAGSGKSTAGLLLAEELGLRFTDGDDLHPEGNVAKMRRGIPLDDNDRRPWLEEVARVLRDDPCGGVVACSALRRNYRDTIRMICPDAFFVHLHGSRELIQRRMAARADHFMPVSLLDSQFAALDMLSVDERGITEPVDEPADEVVRRVGASLLAASRTTAPSD